MNPYGAPAAPPPEVDRMPFVLAAIGAWLASVYWALMSMLILVGTVAGSVSPANLILPAILVALYAHRGYRLYHRDPAMVRSILALHLVGGIFALLQIAQAYENVVLVGMNVVKIAIHVFGLIAALAAKRALTRP